MKKSIKAAEMLLVGLLMAGCSSGAAEKEAEPETFEVPFDGELSHVHGMGYAGNDGGLFFASHSGLKIYRNEKWMETAGNFHDYMGFNAVEKGFYTSGHPSANSDLPNPLGIQRSFDGGESLKEIDFEGETDFHAMAVGYKSQAIFLINPVKNSKLEAGVYKSGNEGQTWEPAKAEGLAGEVAGLALHPENSDYAAAATSEGVFLSDNGGESFRTVTTESERGTAVFFTANHLYFGSFGTSASLMKYTINNGESEKLNLPEMKRDGIAFIAQNPSKELEMALYTLKGRVYLSADGAQSWEPVK